MGQKNYKVGQNNYKVRQLKNYKVGQKNQSGAKKSQSGAKITKLGITHATDLFKNFKFKISLNPASVLDLTKIGDINSPRLCFV